MHDSMLILWPSFCAAASRQHCHCALTEPFRHGSFGVLLHEVVSGERPHPRQPMEPPQVRRRQAQGQNPTLTPSCRTRTGQWQVAAEGRELWEQATLAGLTLEQNKLGMMRVDAENSSVLEQHSHHCHGRLMSRHMQLHKLGCGIGRMVPTGCPQGAPGSVAPQRAGCRRTAHRARQTCGRHASRQTLVLGCAGR